MDSQELINVAFKNIIQLDLRNLSFPTVTDSLKLWVASQK